MLRDTLEIPKGDFNRVASGLFAYLFGLINKKGFYEYTGDRNLARSVISNARGSGYVLKDCKLYAHAHCNHRHTRAAAPSPMAFGVTRSDATFLRRLNCKTERYRVWTPEQFDLLIARSIEHPEMRTYVGKLITKKMSFLIKSYGQSRDDIEQALKAAALFALYKQYPRYESALHAENIVKRTVHNTAMNLIQHHTRGKRTVLRKAVGGAFESVHLPLESVLDVPAESHNIELKDDLMSLVSLAPRLGPRAQAFLTIAAGKFNAEFSEFLGIENHHAVDNMPYQKYLSHARDFFQISEEQTESLFQWLRPRLA